MMDQKSDDEFPSAVQFEQNQDKLKILAVEKEPGPQMPPTKLAEAIGVSIIISIVLHALPIVILPILLGQWLFHEWPSPASVYSNIYEFLWMVCVLITMITIYLEAFKAEITDVELLSQISESLNQRDWLWRYYLYRNRDLVESYRVFIRNGHTHDFGLYLKALHPRLYRRHAIATAYMTNWIGIQHIGSHVRSGHVRQTRNGPVYIRSHGVRGHTRSRR